MILRNIFCALLICAAQGATAQQAFWLQVEAQPGVQAARERASVYAQRIANVAGFQLGSTNWHAIVIGPLDEDAANSLRISLRQQQLVPADSFVTDGRSFGARFWPIGSSAPAPVAPVTSAPVEPSAPEPVALPTDETPAEARRSEALLSAEERRQLQIALQWEGFYEAAIDGAFGRGTRASMEQWQAANGHPATGVLTTRQRDELLTAYNEVLEGLGMETVRDDEAGIEIDLPLAVVGFDSYEPPFAHYGPHSGDVEFPKVLLISQRGDENTLFGLYDIMQTLRIVPEQGEREKRRTSFTLIGEGPDFISQTEAVTRDDTVKGFTLIWPTGDERRRQRVLDQMLASFTDIPGVVMDDLVGDPTEDQRIDLLAGLEIRRPESARSGFYIDGRGHILTTSAAVQACDRITLNEEIEASLVASDPASGLALLSPDQPLSPRAFARFKAGVPRLQSDVVLSGYSYEGILGAPSLTFGTLADLRGLQGEDSVRRLDLAARPGDAGGPVLDMSGAVLGMLRHQEQQDGRALPEQVAFAVDVETIAGFLSDNGLSASAADRGAALRAGVLNDLATDMTVLIGCWN